MKGFFERAMPTAGFVLNTVTSLAAGVLDLISMRIVSKSEGTGIAAGVIGTTSGTVLNWLIFLFSNVREDYEKIGRVIDLKIAPQNNLIRLETAAKVPSNTSYSIIFARIGLSGAVLATSTLDAITQYQEIQSLASSARNEGMHFSESSAFWLGVTLASLNFTTEFLTYNSFANLAIAALIIKNEAYNLEHGQEEMADVSTNSTDEYGCEIPQENYSSISSFTRN